MTANRKSSTILEAEGLELRYSQDVILEDISFCVSEGSCLIIMGASGCGKSTLLKSMTGLLKPASGNVKFRNGLLWSKRKSRMIMSFPILVYYSKLVHFGVP